MYYKGAHRRVVPLPAPAPAPPAWGDLKKLERSILNEIDKNDLLNKKTTITELPVDMLANIYDLLDKKSRQSLATALCTHNGAKPRTSGGSVKALFLLNILQYFSKFLKKSEKNTAYHTWFYLILSKYHAETNRHLSYKTITIRFIYVTDESAEVELYCDYELDDQYYKTDEDEKYVNDIISKGRDAAKNVIDVPERAASVQCPVIESGHSRCTLPFEGIWTRDEQNNNFNLSNLEKFTTFANCAFDNFDIMNIKACGAHISSKEADVNSKPEVIQNLLKISTGLNILKSLLFDAMKKDFKFTQIANQPKIYVSKKTAIVIKESYLLAEASFKKLKVIPSNKLLNYLLHSSPSPSPSLSPPPCISIANVPNDPDNDPIYDLIIPYSVHVSLLQSIDDFLGRNRDTTLERAYLQNKCMTHILKMMLDPAYNEQFTTEGFKSIKFQFTSLEDSEKVKVNLLKTELQFFESEMERIHVFTVVGY